MSTSNQFNTGGEQKVSFAEVKETIANSQYGADYHRRQVSNISGTSSNSRVVRKIVHYENPRQYISFDYKQGTNNSYQQQQIGYTQTQQNSNSGHGNCSCCCKVSSNPLYQFKATNELDIKYRLEKQEQLDELLSRLAHLEQTHLEEIEKLKAQFVIEKQSYERLLTERQVQVQEKIVYVPQKQEDNSLEEQDQCKEELKVVKATLQESELQCSSLQQQLALKEITLNHLKESDRTSELNGMIEEWRTKYEVLREEQIELKEKYIVQSSTDKSTISSLEVRLEGVSKELAISTEKLRTLEGRNNELEKDSIELKVLREQYEKYQSSSESAKQKKKEIKITLNELQATLSARTEELKEIKIELSRKEQEILNLKSFKQVKITSVDETQELAQQNQYLINELGKLTEAYNQLEKSGKIVEKPIFVETVKNITTVKEVPAKIEERTIYVQDTAELERLHAIIRELQQEIVKVNDEKQELQAEYYAEKKQLLNASIDVRQSSQLKQSQVIREVIVERQIDRGEVLQKEELLRRTEAELAEEKIKNAQLQHTIETLTLQLSRLQLNYKIVKLPNSYKLESSSFSSNLQEQHEITLLNNSYQQKSSNQGKLTQSYQPLSAGNYDISNTLHGISRLREQQQQLPNEIIQFTEKKENMYAHQQGQEESSQEFQLNQASKNNSAPFGTENNP